MYFYNSILKYKKYSYTYISKVIGLLLLSKVFVNTYAVDFTGKSTKIMK